MYNENDFKNVSEISKPCKKALNSLENSWKQEPSVLKIPRSNQCAECAIKVMQELYAACVACRMADTSNTFNVLKDESDYGDSNEIKNTIHESVANVVSQVITDCTKLTKDGTGAKELSTTGSGHNTRYSMASNINIGDMLNEIVPKFITALTPLISSVVTAAVNESTKQILSEWEKYCKNMKKRFDTVITTVSKATAEINKQRFELDKLEKNGRKDNIIIHSVPKIEGDNTNQLLIDLANDTGVQLKEEDISVSHRLPGRRRRGV